MAKKKYTQPAPPIEPLTDVPGPEADVSVLRAHYRRVQDAFAVHGYDDVIVVCTWCLKDDQQVPAVGKRAPHKFCCRRCADAHEALMVAAYGYGKGKSKEDDLASVIRRREAAKQEEHQTADDGNDTEEEP